MAVNTDFLYDEVYPRLFDVIDTAFPDMNFQRCSMGWRSNKKLDGSARPRNDKSFIAKSMPFRVKEQGGESMSLIDFYMMQNGLNFGEALERLCRIVGVEKPDFSSESYKAFQERQNNVISLQERLKENLKTEGAKEVLQYLKESRGYDAETIDFMGLGFVDEAAAIEIERIFGKISDIRSYVLSIPYVSSGKLLGYKFRRLDGIMPKYKNTPKLPKQIYMFGLTGLRLTGDNEKDRDITIVEGELDALHAQAIGMNNIVAAAGGEVSLEALERAKTKGVKRVTILFDSEATDKGQKDTTLKIKKAIANIHQCGLKSFVAELPKTEGIKTDVDSFLKDNPKECLEKIINEAISGAVYVFNCIIKDSYDEDINTFKRFDEFKDKTISLLNSPITTMMDRMVICKHFAEITNEPITEQSLREEADEMKSIQNKKEQEYKTIKTAQDALSLAQSGQVKEAIDLMASSSPELQMLNKEAEFVDMLSLPSEKQIKEYMMDKPSGLSTMYQFVSPNNETEDFEIPSGAITFVCALPAHGKSTMLRNLALQVAEGSDEGCVLYYTFEEDKNSVVLQMMNTHINKPLSANNMKSIVSYYRLGSPQMIRESERITFEEGRRRFMDNLYHSGKLRVYGEDFDSKEMIESISYISRNIKVKAVFIDYIQLLKKRGCRLQRTEELKEICVDLKNLAVSSGLPIVAAAQLNRETRSPIDMCSQNIAEAADLERIANKIVCLWNCKFEPRYARGESRKAIEEFESDYNVTLGSDDKIFAKITKNRGGMNNITAVLEMNGNTGAIEPKTKRQSVSQQKPQCTFYGNGGKTDLPF